MGCGLSDKPGDDRYDFPAKPGGRFFGADGSLALDRVTLMVHDWGGMIAMAWAVANPHRVARI
jgi:pimeloyl-ACP methyl ester carboxylesterase